MKKLSILLVMLLSLSAVVYAADELPQWQAAVQANCGNVCVEGLPAAWQVQVTNVGKVDFKLQQVQIFDSSGLLIADTGAGEIDIPVGKGTIASLQGILPPPTRSQTWFFKICYTVNNQVSCDQQDRRMIIMPLTEVECTKNQTCPREEACFNFKCMPKTVLMNNSEYAKYKPSVFKIEYVTVGLLAVILILLLVLVIKMPNTTTKAGKKE